MAKSVRLGIAGSGSRGVSVGKQFMQVPGCQVTALMDRFPACTQRAAERMNLTDVSRYTDYDRFLREAPIDAVFLAGSPMEQVQMACEALARGKHVCTEVPMAFSMDEIHAIIAAVEQTGCKYQLMEQLRYAGFVQTWKQMVDRGELGHINQAQGEYVHFRRNWGYFTDLDTGEILQDLEPPAGRRVEPTWRYHILAEPILYLPHTLSPLLTVLSDRVVRVSCMGTQKRSYAYPEHNLPWHDIQYALMHTARDTVLLVGASFSMVHVSRGPLSSHWYELRGSRGSVESPRHPDEKFHVFRGDPQNHVEYKGGYETMDLGAAPIDATEAEKASGHGGLDYRAPRLFIESIQNDTRPPVDVYTAAEFTAPAILAAESARQGGKLIEVPQFRRAQGRGPRA